jgi:hypothetical protein
MLYATYTKLLLALKIVPGLIEAEEGTKVFRLLTKSQVSGSPALTEPAFREALFRVARLSQGTLAKKFDLPNSTEFTPESYNALFCFMDLPSNPQKALAQIRLQQNAPSSPKQR